MSQDPSNASIAGTFTRVAELLEGQGASPKRVRAWREGAEAVRAEARPVAELLRVEGRAGVEAVVGRGLAGAVVEVARTHRCRVLERLQGEVSPRAIFADLPGVGAALAGRIHRELGVETLEDLERAAHDGRLAALAGFGDRRVAAVRDLLATRLTNRRFAPAPPVALLLELDRRYRELDAAGELRRIAPRRFNPGHKAWLPVWHEERDGWDFTLLYSNTALAHDLAKTHDWVIVYYDRDGEGGRATVVTQRGVRVVRGREAESWMVHEGMGAVHAAG